MAVAIGMIQVYSGAHCSSHSGIELISVFILPEYGDVKIVWSSGHEGHVNLDWLRRHCYSHHSLEEARRKTTPKLLSQVNNITNAGVFNVSNVC